ncbi:hypothetical protein [Caldimonas brevitalea]|uniref:Uncharacterized protein n=1 Tax=Caldimonas brevitalea TaxID=413882 RepID=A0A0G3BUF1_9BURK|nr:hypothetical protein [Caldimonas brevitalea]AKJ30160.1 hypothetical protein AAW51_3469 [Caldimonas brevitalea]
MTRHTLIKAMRPSLARTIATLLLTTAWTSPALAEGRSQVAGPRLQGEPNCRFAAPEGWRDHAVRWEGGCVNGKASGPGVLRAYAKHKPTEFFYGRLVDGTPRLGVLEQPDGFVAGEFDQGGAVQSDDRDVAVRALREAAQAAKLASVRFKDKGNEASARFYLGKAEQLDAQLD